MRIKAEIFAEVIDILQICEIIISSVQFCIEVQFYERLLNMYNKEEKAAAVSEKKEQLSGRENAVQVVKFALFSVSAGIIETVSFALLNELTRWSYWPCYLIALTLSVLWNFTLNREFTFKSANNVPVAMMKVAGFYCVFTPLSTWWGSALTDAGWNAYVVLLGTMAVNLTTEFLYDRFFVFRGTMNTNKRAVRADEKGGVMGNVDVENDENAISRREDRA